jgi:site-specific DNA-methyltransferase (cytosine-N4-specific)
MTAPTVHYDDDQITLWCGDALATLRQMPDQSVNCAVTSPPYYGLRDYGEPGQYGLEATPAAYVDTMRAVFGEVRRVLTTDGTLWLNLGDTYASKANAGASVGMTRRADRAEVIPARVNTTGEAPYKSLLMIPERVAWALIEDGWTLRNRIVWHKPNAMPESVTDRLSTRHEALFLFARSPRYWFDQDAIREPYSKNKPWGTGIKSGLKVGAATAAIRGTPIEAQQNGLGRPREEHPLGRIPGDVWPVNTEKFGAAHFAVMPPTLAERCILAGCRPGGKVLDPFAGSGTTGMVALKTGRRFVGIDLSATYLDLALRTRLAQGALMFDEVAS